MREKSASSANAQQQAKALVTVAFSRRFRLISNEDRKECGIRARIALYSEYNRDNFRKEQLFLFSYRMREQKLLGKSLKAQKIILYLLSRLIICIQYYINISFQLMTWQRKSQLQADY